MGGELGAELGFEITERLSIIADIRGAVIHSRTRLKAADCLGNAAPIGSACSGGFYTTAHEDKDTNVNYRASGSIGTIVALPLG